MKKILFKLLKMDIIVTKNFISMFLCWLLCLIWYKCEVIFKNMIVPEICSYTGKLIIRGSKENMRISNTFTNPS